jgi:hypothetical protein
LLLLRCIIRLHNIYSICFVIWLWRGDPSWVDPIKFGGMTSFLVSILIIGFWGMMWWGISPFHSTDQTKKKVRCENMMLDPISSYQTPPKFISIPSALLIRGIWCLVSHYFVIHVQIYQCDQDISEFQFVYHANFS